MIKTFIEKEKVEDKSGATAMKYDEEFLKECVLLKKKSVAAYKHIRARKLLPLPSIGTVQKIINSEGKIPTASNTSAPTTDVVGEAAAEVVIEISPEAQILLNNSCVLTSGETSTVVATG